MKGYEAPLAAWRVHGTAAKFYERAGNIAFAGHHRDLARGTIFKLANSLLADHPLRTTFLSAAPVCRVLDGS